ncbi:MAG: hypothetical protein DRO73_06400 [Candidatus Thorarchaeota archaeon]|nr:MAG: hypothetical protein DRO73_06400 [Candidatus Thorarchaeota archaeon]RLI57560.1 MAG: hypothetical protein DRO93_10535 [Candidatus Thorarchaeota archaeon]
MSSVPVRNGVLGIPQAHIISQTVRAAKGVVSSPLSNTEVVARPSRVRTGSKTKGDPVADSILT